MVYKRKSKLASNDNLAITLWFQPNLKEANPNATLIDGYLSGKGLKVSTTSNNLSVKINGESHSFTYDNEILNDVWHGVVINVNNKYSKLTANVFKLEPGSNLLNSNTTQTGITSVLNDSKDISAYDWNSLKQWSLMPGPAKLTNVRLFNKSIEAEQRLNVLQQYIVRDNKFALVIDNAVPSIQLRRYNQNR